MKKTLFLSLAFLVSCVDTHSIIAESKTEFEKSDIVDLDNPDAHSEQIISETQARLLAIYIQLLEKNETQAARLACALAMQLQDSEKNIEQELYEKLCQYISIKFFEESKSSETEELEENIIQISIKITIQAEED